MINRFMLLLLICALSGILMAGCASTTKKPINRENSDRIGTLHQKVNSFRDMMMDFETSLKLMETKLDGFENRLNRLTSEGIIKAQPKKKQGMAPPAAMIPAGSSSAPDSGHTIKVLSGTGVLSDGKALASDLKAAGYDVKRVDLASSKFKKDTVFYSAGLEEEAKALAMIIGPDTDVKSLSWNSSFDFIAVAGP